MRTKECLLLRGGFQLWIFVLIFYWVAVYGGGKMVCCRGGASFWVSLVGLVGGCWLLIWV